MSPLPFIPARFRRHPWLVFGVIFLAIAAVAEVAALVQTLGELRYGRDGAVVEGTVLSKHARAASREKDTVRYRFTTLEGEEVESRSKVGFAAWESLRERGPIRVHYLRSNPWTNRPAGEGGWGEPIVLVLFGGVFGAIGGLMFRKGFSGYRLDERLRREGEAAEATVTAVVPGNLRINRVTQSVIRYRFTDGQGRVWEGQSGELPPEEADAWRSRDKGQILFNPKNAAESIWIGKA